jgi:hypothetical protein
MFRNSERFRKLLEEHHNNTMEARVNANPKWFFPFLKKEQRSTMRAMFEGETGAFIQEIEIKRRWHEVNQFG